MSEENEITLPEPIDDGLEKPDVGPTSADDLEALRVRAREVPILDWGPVQRPWMKKFLNALAFRPVIAFACRSVKVSDESVRLWREKDPDFNAAVERALRLGQDTVEEAALIRAVDGVPKAIFGKQDQVIGVEMKYSDGLAEMLLKGYRPERFREKQSPLININAGPGFIDLLRQNKLESPEIGEKLVEGRATDIEPEGLK